MFGDFSFVDIAVLVSSLLVAMTIHEAMHAYMGLLLGDTTAQEQGRISLNPLDHIDPLTTVALPIVTLLLFHAPILAAKPVPFNPGRVRFGEFGAALVALAVPVSNLAMAIIAAILLRLVDPQGFLAGVLFAFVSLNIALFVFNLVPIPPLDGSRVLYAFAPEPLQRLMAEIEPYGLYVIFGLVLLGGFGGALSALNDFVLHLLV